MLFIDDEPIVCRSIGKCLERFGFRVALAMSGEAALDQLQRAEFDVIVSDVQMPGMGGIELVSKILGSWPRMAGRILITSGDVGSEAARALVARTGCTPIQKPFPLADLIAAIRERLLATAA
ncbi:MAG: response regulator [Gemmatimonadota bacterium]